MNWCHEMAGKINDTIDFENPGTQVHLSCLVSQFRL